MKSQYIEAYYDKIEDRIVKKQAIKANPKYLRKPSIVVQQFIKAQDDSRVSFDFTYKASRHEESWLLKSLGDLYEHQWISDVLRMVKGGKEASVYLCKGGTATGDILVAAKVYRPRMLRNLKNDRLYRFGRTVLDEDGKQTKDLGMLMSQKKRSVYGEQIRHQSWITFELMALKELFEAGADVPKVYEMTPNAILMGFVGDEFQGAPTLNSVSLGKTEAKALYERVMHNIELMLTHGIVHADLSAYNILYWEGEIKIIDFPQMVNPKSNPYAYAMFVRDVTRICEYFATQGIASYPQRLADRLWKAHGYQTSIRKIPEEEVVNREEKWLSED